MVPFTIHPHTLFHLPHITPTKEPQQDTIVRDEQSREESRMVTKPKWMGVEMDGLQEGERTTSNLPTEEEEGVEGDD